MIVVGYAGPVRNEAYLRAIPVSSKAIPRSSINTKLFTQLAVLSETCCEEEILSLLKQLGGDVTGICTNLRDLYKRINDKPWKEVSLKWNSSKSSDNATIYEGEVDPEVILNDTVIPFYKIEIAV